MLIRGMLWNICDGGAVDMINPQRDNIRNILVTIDRAEADLVVCAEYISEYSEFTDGLKKLGYCFFAVNSDAPDRTLRKRLLIASKLPLEKLAYPDTLRAYDRRNWVEVEIACAGRKLRFLGVQVPLAETRTLNGKTVDQTEAKRLFLAELSRKFREYAQATTPSAVLGDLNLHASCVHSKYLSEFGKILKEVTTTDPTWRNQHGAYTYKLDYIYANKPFLEILKNEDPIAPTATAFSDHKYACFDLNL